MGITTLNGAEQDHYMGLLTQALELAADALPTSDCAYVRELIRIADFGKDLPSLDRIDVDTETGLPGKSLVDKLAAHKKFIERANPPDPAIKQRLIEGIKGQIYDNDFSFVDDLTQLRECLFSERLREIDFSANRGISITPGNELDDGINVRMKVRGYDTTKSGWISYDTQLFMTKDPFWRPNRYVRKKDGKLRPTKELTNTVDELFCFNARRWFERFSSTKGIRAGSVQLCAVKGFYTEATIGTHKDLYPLAPDFTKDTWILDYEQADKEDTDITMSEVFDDSFFAPDYQPEMITEEKRVLIVSPDIERRANLLAHELPYQCSVISLNNARGAR